MPSNNKKASIQADLQRIKGLYYVAMNYEILQIRQNQYKKNSDGLDDHDNPRVPLSGLFSNLDGWSL